METKGSEIVSDMKNKILDEAISSLQGMGLKFSVDTLAEKLKISKKTVYKFFPNKEALALAMYERYYLDANQKVKELLEKKEADLPSKLLRLYYESMNMIRSEIFNKYNLNEVILSYAQRQNQSLWAAISKAFPHAGSEQGNQVLQIIISGTFEKLYDVQGDPDLVIERLVALL